MSSGGIKYRIASGLSEFQRRMYIHLIEWKHRVLKVTEPGWYNGHPYDYMFPDWYVDAHPVPPFIYDGALEDYRRMQVGEYAFKVHKMAYHMASSQTACVNLFLPVLMDPDADKIIVALPGAPSDFVKIDRDRLFDGFCFEYWGQDFAEKEGVLGDHSKSAGTDSDLAVAYINDKGQRCLWLIEHKLTEKEFTTCGGFRSKANKAKSMCRCSRINDFVADPCRCHYHNIGYRYWDVMKNHHDAFNADAYVDGCPWRGGMNQLWRNHLLAFEYVDRGQYDRVTFSVVHHRDNDALEATMKEYRTLICPAVPFSSFTNEDLVEAAERCSSGLGDWTRWYRELYLNL